MVQPSGEGAIRCMNLALKKTNQKFYNRFNFIEKIVKKNNQKIEDISLAELLNYWEKAKNEEK